MTAPDPGWRDGIEAVQTEAGGLLSLDVVLPVDFADLFGCAAAGDRQAARLACAVIDTVARVNKTPRKSPALCGSCPRPVRRSSFSVVIATPERNDPTRAIGLAICERCGITREEITDKAVIALKRIWPNSRAVTINADHLAGHA